MFFYILNQILNANNAKNLKKNIVCCFAFFIAIENDTQFFFELLKHEICSKHVFQKSSSNNFDFKFDEYLNKQKNVFVVVSCDCHKKRYVENISNVRFCKIFQLCNC